MKAFVAWMKDFLHVIERCLEEGEDHQETIRKTPPSDGGTGPK